MARRPVKKLSSYTLHGYAQVTRSFFRWCQREGFLLEGPFSRVEMPKVDEVIVPALSPEQVGRLMVAVRQTRYPLRNRALVSLMLDTGLRLSEVVGLKVENLQLEGKDPHATVMGKGRRQRSIFIGPETRLALLRYYLERDHSGGPYVFETYFGKPLGARALESIIKRLGQSAGIAGLHSHQLRHTNAASYLRAGGSVFHLSRLLGYSNLQTTERYLAVASHPYARSGAGRARLAGAGGGHAVGGQRQRCRREQPASQQSRSAASHPCRAAADLQPPHPTSAQLLPSRGARARHGHRTPSSRPLPSRAVANCFPSQNLPLRGPGSTPSCARESRAKGRRW
jgi:site-specific recombinase XerD